MSDKSRIDGQKMDLHPARIAAWLAAKDDWDKAKDIFPMYMEISPIGVCNHECTFCSVDYMLDRKDAPKLAGVVLERTLVNAAVRGVLSVMFAGAGEPLLWRGEMPGQNLGDIILHADKVNLDTAITSNSVLLTSEFCEKAFQAKCLRWIRTSINAGDAGTYAKIHRTKPKDFYRVLQNLEQAVKIRDRMGSGVQILGQIVVVPEAEGTSRRSDIPERYPSNIHTVIPLAKLLRDIGVDNLAVKPYTQHMVCGTSRTRMYKDVTYKKMMDAFAEVETLATEKFEVTVRYQTMKNWDAEERGYKTCYSTPYHWAYVEADGEVWGCSAYVGRMEAGKEVAGDHRFRFGNVNNQLFSEIWQGERRKACWEYTRKPSLEGGLDVNKCMRNCQMDKPNRWLDELVHPVPTVNFIK